MIFRILVVVISIVGTISWSCPAFSAGETDACETRRSGWTEAQEGLKQAMDSCREIKEAPLASRIQRELSSQREVSIADGIQAVLKERSDALATAVQQCRHAAAAEAQAFEDWRRCARGNRSRKDKLSQASPDSVVASRKQMLSALQDLLLDEAYTQYKNYRAPAPPSAYSEHRGRQEWATGSTAGNRAYWGYGYYQ